MVNDSVDAIEFTSTDKREDLDIKLEMMGETIYKSPSTITIKCLPYNLNMKDFIRPIRILSVGWKEADYFKGKFSDTCATELNLNSFSVDNKVDDTKSTYFEICMSNVTCV